MTRATSERRAPGSFLLKVAEFIFDEAALASVVAPTISDLQEELREAGDSRGRRVRARLRGYGAFWALVVLAPWAFLHWPARTVGATHTPDRSASILFSMVVASFALLTWHFIGWWTIVAAVGGVLVALVIHDWHSRHPSKVATPVSPFLKTPEINVSKISVGGNIAGLMYVLGSLAVGMVGLVFLRWFFVVTLVCGFLCARALLLWHNSHRSGLTRISLR